MRRRDVILNELEGMIKKQSGNNGTIDPAAAIALRQYATLEVLLDIRDLLQPKDDEAGEQH
jgi:hypothetical protein